MESGPLPRTARTFERPTYFCVGVGAGPANLSLAALLSSYPDTPNLFLERNTEFGWHDGQLFPESGLQVSFFKDLTTPADPTNPYSFLSYLHEQGKLYHFINARFESVPRAEFRNYLAWAVRKNKNISLGEDVVAVEFDDTHELFVVQTNKRAVAAANVAVGIGSEPWIPSAAPDCRHHAQFHVSEFVTRSYDLSGKHVSVVGGGQSGAEAFLDLISRPDTERPQKVFWISRRRNYFPIDDSPFTNDFFMPCYSDYFSSLEPATREMINDAHVLASDGISEKTLRDIYQRCYVHRFVRGDGDLIALYPNRTVTQVTPTDGRYQWLISMESNDEPGRLAQIPADVIIWATGFRPARLEILAPLAERIEWEKEEPKVDCNFAVCWDGPRDHNIFVQNATRLQRGLADPNLSLVAWRSQQIVERMLGTRSNPQLHSWINW